MSNAILELRDVTRNFRQGTNELSILKKSQLALQPGEIVALVGPSGSGKTTLLQIAGLLDRPNKGSVILQGVNYSTANDTTRTAARSKTIGFIYQFHHLLPEFSALENVMLPQMIAGRSKAEAKARAASLLHELGLAERVEHRPAQLSGGEQQRVAIARAMANRPALLLADEPTGNLDPHTAEQVFSLLVSLAREHGLAALIATHNLDLARRMDRRITVLDGVVTAV